MAFLPLNDYMREALEREKRGGRTQSFFVVIPYYIFEDRDLTPATKLILGEISSLANKYGYCYANNRHFWEALKCGVATIRRSLRQLEKKGYIKIEVEKNENGTHRKIWITCVKPVEKKGGCIKLI